MNVNTVGKSAHAWKNNRLLMAVTLVVLFLAGFYYGGGWISEPYGSWSLKVVLFFFASVMAVGAIIVLRRSVAKNINLEAMERNIANRNLGVAESCFVSSILIAAILLMFTNSIDPIDSVMYALYGGMLVTLAFGIALTCIFVASTLQNSIR
ncbi:MAG: hypothetical protein SA339_05065 [Methanomassiliicoccus sp.]|nr:hypothetical protein [Methanomassiliicoccus sp.]